MVTFVKIVISPFSSLPFWTQQGRVIAPISLFCANCEPHWWDFPLLPGTSFHIYMPFGLGRSGPLDVNWIPWEELCDHRRVLEAWLLMLPCRGFSVRSFEHSRNRVIGVTKAFFLRVEARFDFSICTSRGLTFYNFFRTVLLFYFYFHIYCHYIWLVLFSRILIFTILSN